jgi:trehalose/maltose hydrolase-like predicted phosphorylase
MTIQSNVWSVTETDFNPEKMHHGETVFTLGNGYLGTRGAFEEAHPGEVRSTFLHGVFDDVPVFFTELANAPDWLELEIILAGERFGLDQGELLAFIRSLDLKTGCLRRDLTWRSPGGRETRLVFERFASLSDRHLCALRVSITPGNYAGRIEVRTGLNGEADNLAFKHWDWLGQGLRGQTAWLQSRTHTTGIELAVGVRLTLASGGQRPRLARWDVRNHPTLVISAEADMGGTVTAVKWVTYHTSREGKEPLRRCLRGLRSLATLEWSMAWEAHCRAWDAEWEQCDVLIEGDDQAQLAVRFNLFQLLSAAPREDERVSIGAKMLSGYGYRGHAFWDTEIFMLPFFSYTRPEIARNLLSYRWHNLPGARTKALGNGYRGAQFPWESAGSGEEVTPTWVPDPKDRTKLIRIWTGDIEVHISADIAYAIWQYWQMTGDEAFLLGRGAEVLLETARFWSSRVEWDPERKRFEISDIVGPDEYHDHVDNNVYTNALARWNLQTALDLVAWMKEAHPAEWRRLNRCLHLNDDEFKRWQEVIDRIYLPFDAKTKLIEQFEGYFQRKDIDLAALEPRTESVQALFGIEGINETQVLKQPDVLMLMYVLPGLYDAETMRANFTYYNARTDHTFGSSLGPSIQAIMACRADDPSACEHFMRAARADLYDVRNNTGDGIHGASAGGLWQAVVFGFAGLEHTSTGWQVHPRLPANWTRLAFRIVDHGRVIKFDLKH